MTADGNTPEPSTHLHQVRWRAGDMERLKRAARVWSERDNLQLSVADVVRSGALEKADTILGPRESEPEQK